MKQPETLAPLSTARNALGTRFCHACNDFRPIDQFRKGQGHVCRQHVEVPDPDGLRFCRVCQDLLPLSRFAADQKRFICRACTWKRTGKPARTKYRARLAHIQRLWSMCYLDRAAFDQPRVGVTQTDIARLLEAGSFTVSDANKLAVMPPDPRLPMGKENAVLVTREQRRRLLRMLAAGGSEAYGNEMMKMTELAPVARIDTDSKIDQIDADIMDYTDTDFTTACNLLPNIVALPVCV